MPPATRRQDDLTPSAPVSAENTPPSEVRHKLPRRLRPRQHGRKQPATPANKVRHPAWLTQQPRLSHQPMRIHPAWLPVQRPGRGQRPIGILPLPGPQPGTSRSPRSAFVKHPQSFQSSHLPQHPGSTTNQNRDRQFRLDHPEIQGVYKPARIDPRQDSPANRQRDNFSGLGLSSPALQQPTTKPFSGSPARQLMTDPIREAREAGRQRPGIVYPLPRDARPDTRLSIDATPPEAAALSRGERPPTVMDIPEPGRIGGTRLPGPSQLRG